MDTARIAYCKIHPGVGIARVGNSPDAYFIGPEAPGIVPVPLDGRYKDDVGRVKRQAARFRIYAYAENGEVLGELGVADAAIEWTVHLANTKADWFGFQSRFDTNPKTLRNAKIGEDERYKLRIDPGPRTIAGRNAGGDAKYRFDGGNFFDKPVPLGELRTDRDGHLLVLGGFGDSEAPAGEPIVQYANNDGWHDDTSDGPVSATVVLHADGREIKVTPAHVLVAPTDFAPATENIVTLFDVAEHVALRSGKEPPQGDGVVFSRDVLPLLQRAVGYTWVSALALRGHGDGYAGDFLSKDRLAKLADPAKSAAPIRQALFKRFRNPLKMSPDEANAYYMPQLWGDGGQGDTTSPPTGDPQTWLYVTETQYARLAKWAKGEFTDAPQPKPLPLADLPLAAQPYALDRSSLEACVGGPFYPGIEMTYIALEPKTWSEPFRLDADSFGAGDATKWMACPWQADFYECMIQWWPAQRPDDVITEAIYDEAVSEYQRGHANETFAAMLAGRERWDRDLPYDTGANPTAGDTQMVKSWSEMGFVVERRGPDHKPVFVETERAPYAGKDLREYFYLLLNIDAHQDFLPKARSLAEFYLNAAWEQIQQPDFATPEYRFFDYSKPAFDARLMQIYRAYEQDGKYYDPASDPDYPDREACIYRTQQLAPFNQLDGAWIRTVTQAGPIDEINSLLFAIWADEVGNGDPRLNHCNLYSDLLRDVGVYMPEIRSRAYAQNPALLDAAFDVPVFELSISQFPEEYFPELLGMTLQLEWEVLSLRRTAKLLQYFGINTHFYVMHIGIDNASEGHGAKAKRAVELFLDHVMQNQGEEAMQRAWRRIWNGYVAFGLTGGLGNAIADFNRARHARNLGERDQLQAAIEQMIADKQEFAQLNHGNKRLGPDYLNDLFEDPTAFTRALIESGYIIPGNPENSPFFSKLTYEGPMFKVFTDEEIQLWMDWTRSLAHSDGHAEKSIAELMVDAVTMLKGRQYGERMHESAFLAGADENGARVVRSVTEWLEGDPLHFLNALRNPENNLILPGYPEASPFIEERLSMDTPMGRAWAAVAPKSRGRSWREITVAWVKDHCLLPGETIDQLHTALSAIAVRDAGGAAVATALRPPELAHSVRRIVKPYGNHAVH